MTRLILAALGAFAIMGSVAHAEDRMESDRIALDLAQVLGAEKTCGLAFDQGAVEAFIVSKVKPDDMQFSGHLAMFSRVAAGYATEMTPSEKTAHCTQITRVARAYKFIK
jgi:hypothetical protein